MYEETCFCDHSSMTEGVNDVDEALNMGNFDPCAHLIQEPNQVLESNWDTHQEADLLNLLHLTRSTTSSLGYSGDLPSSSDHVPPAVLYDPQFHPNMPPQLPLFGGLYEDGNNYVVDEFNGDIGMACIGRRKSGKAKKPIISERQKRVEMNDKYILLRSLVPNSNPKTDRASVVGEACEYIKELQRTVNEFKLLVEKKLFLRESIKRQKGCDMKPFLGPNDSLRSSWIQRKFKDTEVDVRIIDDEVTIKLVQRKNMDCLLVVSRVLDELQLDLQHVAGGHIGDYSSFLFNTKIYEGSSVYAGAIANKLIEVMDKNYEANFPPINGY